MSHLVASVGSVPTLETSGGATTTVAPVRGELSATWQKNSGPSREILAQPHLRAPKSQHTMRKKTLEPNQRYNHWDSKRLPNPWPEVGLLRWGSTALYIARPVGRVHSGHINFNRSVPRSNHACHLPDHCDNLHGADESGNPLHGWLPGTDHRRTGRWPP